MADSPPSPPPGPTLGASGAVAPTSSASTRDGELFAWLLILLGAAVRLYYASAAYLNPDEAMHVSAAMHHSWADAYEASRHLAHPPLLVLATHATLVFGRSELFLRTPCVVVGVLTLWLAYRWLDRSAGRVAALAGLAFLTVSPAMIASASEVRQASWMLLFTCAALCSAERFAARHRVADAALLSLSLCGALLAHYSAAWIVAALAAYLALRLRLAGSTRRVWLTWALLQVPVAAVGYWSLFIHGERWAPKFAAASVSPSRPGGAQGFSYLAPALHHVEKESVGTFAARGVYDVWQYFCGSGVLAIFILAILALASVIAWRAGAWRERPHFLVIVILPFAIGALAGILRLYPFAGSRHVAYLLPFAAAAVGIAAARLLQQRLGYAEALIAVAVPLWLWSTVPANDPALMARANMKAALAYVDSRPQGSRLVVDFQTIDELAYYWRDRAREVGRVGPLRRIHIGERRLLATQYAVWALTDRNMAAILKIIIAERGLRPGQEIWAMSTGWPNHPPPKKLPRNLEVSIREFGQTWVLRARMPNS